MVQFMVCCQAALFGCALFLHREAFLLLIVGGSVLQPLGPGKYVFDSGCEQHGEYQREGKVIHHHMTSPSPAASPRPHHVVCVCELFPLCFVSCCVPPCVSPVICCSCVCVPAVKLVLEFVSCTEVLPACHRGSRQCGSSSCL